MAVIERDVVLIGKDASGNETIDFPIARLGNIEGNADVKDAPESTDYIPLMDNSDRGQMKKTTVNTLLNNIPTVSVDKGGTGAATAAEALANLGAAPKDSPVFLNSVSMGRTEGSTVGQNSVAVGSSSVASAKCSFTEGTGSEATSDNAHAEGEASIASGDGAHAEGHSTASGRRSHSEGNIAKASGDYSHSEGMRTTASGQASHAEGNWSSASGKASHAEGSAEASGTYSHAEGSAEASGEASHAEGGATKAPGSYSHSEGSRTIANGEASHAEGKNNISAGVGSHAEGVQNVVGTAYVLSVKSTDAATKTITFDPGFVHHAAAFAKLVEGSKIAITNSNANAAGSLTAFTVSTIDAANNAVTVTDSIPTSDFTPKYAVITSETPETTIEAGHAEGCQTLATGDSAHAEGYSTTASGSKSHAEGEYTTASNYASHAGGHYNKKMTDGGNSTNTTGDAFVIGNGTGLTNLSNAFRVTFAGDAYGLSAFNSSGADYAEYFEWSDGNPDNEDRVGYFVTMEDDKICIARPGNYILGIVSSQPCIIGNADEDWLGRWEHDEFGRFITEEAEEGGWRYKANPDYDASQEYIERKHRPEWSAVGMLGVLSVRDDGSCKVNGFCKVAETGIATAAEANAEGAAYRVIKRVADNVIKVVFK